MSASKALTPIQLAPLDCVILIVAVSDRQALLATQLLRNGFHKLLFAADADTALRSTISDKPDLVLLDRSGAQPDFLHLCRTLRQSCGRSDVSVLAMIAPQEVDDQPSILAAGAADVLIKPLSELQLIARILMQLERQLLIRNLLDFQQRTAAELATARDMQNALLPDEATIRQIKERYDIGIAAAFKPSAELGGDLWGAWSIDATRMGVYACDVSGHGTIAAINTFRLHTIMARNDFDRSDAGRFLSSLNDRLTGLLVGGQFITMFYAVIDIRRDCITYAAAGSPEPLLALPGCLPEGLDGSGVPLGIVAGIPYPTQQVPFGPGARLVLQSDALAEARLADDALLGNPAATAMVTAALAFPTPEAVIACLTQDIADRVGESLDDDLTLVCIERSRQVDDHRHLVPAAPQSPVTGRLLLVGRPTAHRLLVQQSAAALALAVDVAPDLTCASRFLAEYSYDVVVVDVSPVPEEWLELFRTIVSANRRGRVVSIGMHARMAKLLTTSLGLAFVATLEMPVDAAALRDALDAALAGDNPPSGKGVRRPMTEADLRHSLEAGEITCSFQPQMSLTTGRLVGAEALARWSTEEYGAISSNAFMSLVANGGAAVLLADVTLRAALAACALWRTSASGMGVAVNFSAASLAEPDLASLVLARLREANVAPDALTVEVAEADAVRSIPTLAALHQIGVNVGLDGFGHGETSLLSLGQLPIGTVKIGRSVVRTCVADPAAMRLLHAIIGASRAFNLKVAAVGVEIHAEEQMLREAGCEIAQGWLYGPAMPANAILKLLALP
jgi:sigma-B regulation protein RsbU (phosphoserine phosphatase)